MLSDSVVSRLFSEQVIFKVEFTNYCQVYVRFCALVLLIALRSLAVAERAVESAVDFPLFRLTSREPPSLVDGSLHLYPALFLLLRAGAQRSSAT